MRPHFIGIVVAPHQILDPFQPETVTISGCTRDYDTGDVVVVSAGEATSRWAEARSAKAELFGLLVESGIDLVHPPDVLRETEHWLANPGIDDPALLDLRTIPFVTIDGPKTRDLDQAVHVRRDGAGFVVLYALADAAYYVRPGTALFREALERGASFYLPGLSAPMLPRSLSEGLVSLNPGVDRRAMVFEMRLDARGQCIATDVHRARIHSRMQLTFDDVLAALEGREHPITDVTIVESLRALEAAGEARLAFAADRDAVQHRNAEIRVELSAGRERGFVVVEEMRNRVERYNEQISLLCNIEGALLMRRHAASDEQLLPIYRTHAAPTEARLAELETRLATVSADRNEPSLRWVRAEQSLRAYLAGLRDPIDSPLMRALSRQAIMVNVQSTFSADPGPHFGIGAEVYSRFSAPMREVVGVFVHKELWELLGHQGNVGHDELRDSVIAAANRSRQRQRTLTHQANRLVLDRLFEPQLALEDRPTLRATVMGLRGSKVYVQLDEPPLDVKVYADELDPPARADATEARLMRGEQVVCRLGDEVSVRLRSHDGKRDRWVLELV